MSDLEAIKEELTWEYILELCEMEHVDVSGAGTKISSFTHRDETPSLHLYPDGHWFDYSTGKGGDQFSFIMDYLGISFGRALKLLKRGVGDPLAYGRPINVEARERMVHDFAPELEDNSFPMDTPLGHTEAKVRVAEWAKRKWGVYPMTLQMWGVRFNLRDTVLIPHYLPTGEAYGVHLRYLTGKVKTKAIPGSTFHHGFYQRRPIREGSTLVICEGEPDTWALWDLLHRGMGWAEGGRWDVIGLPSGALMQREEWFKPLLGRPKSFICLDDGFVGREATDQALDICPTLVPLILPDDGDVEDVGDAVRLDYRVDFETARWVQGTGLGHPNKEATDEQS